MTKPKPRPLRAVDAVSIALDREEAKRPEGLKPIEIVKVAISAYQAHYYYRTQDTGALESADRAGLRRGAQSAVDRLLFNVNYWLSAYETRIVESCSGKLDADEVNELLRSIATWNSHTMRLNKLTQADTVAVFERFCPPLSTNDRRGQSTQAAHNKGPIPSFSSCVRTVAEKYPKASNALLAILNDVNQEVEVYKRYENAPALDAFYDLLPAWCLQERIDLVTATWWNDVDVMMLVADRLAACFRQSRFADALCSYYLDAMHESIDNYSRTVATDETQFRTMQVPQLVDLVHNIRQANPNSEIEGYGSALPAWLDSKEQLIWNTIVCAIYGPMHARPLLVDDLALLPVEGKPADSDVITDLAQRAYQRYIAVRRESGADPGFESYEAQPSSLRDSGLSRIESLPRMLDILGYRIVPLSSCAPGQFIERFRASEVECLAILEHRRWMAERIAAGWVLSATKDVAAKQSPYLVDWDDLPDREREWNRSAIRDIPALLASAGLAIA